MPDKTCIGIDIGTSRLKVAVRKRGVVRRVISEPVPDGLMRENHIVSYDAMGDFLKETLKKNRVSVKNAHLSMPTHELYLRTVTLPMMNVQQLKVNLPYEFHDYITEDMDQYIYDYSVLPDDEGDGQLHLMAVAAGKKLIASHMQMAKRAHIKLETIQPANVPITRVLEAALKAHEKDPTRDYAFLDLGDTSIKIHFFKKGRYEMTRSMDVGIGQVVLRISEETGSDAHIARVNLETNAGDIQRAPYLEDVYSDLASQIMRVMNFYNFNNRDNTLEDLIYFGGGGLMPAFLDVIREMVPLNLRSAAQVFQGKMKVSEENVLIGLKAIGMTI